MIVILKENVNLKMLELGRNHIHPDGAKALALAVRINHVLEELDIEQNAFGVEGAVAIASARCCGAPLSRRTGRRMRALMPPRVAPGAERTLRRKISRHAARPPRRPLPCPGRRARTSGATVAGVGEGGETM